MYRLMYCLLKDKLKDLLRRAFRRGNRTDTPCANHSKEKHRKVKQSNEMTCDKKTIEDPMESTLVLV